MIRLNRWQELTQQDKKEPGHRLSDILPDADAFRTQLIDRPSGTELKNENEATQTLKLIKKRQEVEDLIFWSDLASGNTDKGLFIKAEEDAITLVNNVAMVKAVDEHETPCTILLSWNWMRTQETKGRPTRDSLKDHTTIKAGDILCLYDYLRTTNDVLMVDKFHF